jgi:hypothetical protein
MTATDDDPATMNGENNGNGRQQYREPVHAEIVTIPNNQEAQSLDIQVMTARRFPRSIANFKAEANSLATIDEETAASCFFSLPRGGKPIEGPSVRLAEICAYAWGHLTAHTRIVEIGDKFVTAQAIAWDMQKNVRISQEVSRRITTKSGQRYNDDMILMTCNAAASIALRNAIFRVIPRCYVDAVYRQARKTAIGNEQTLTAKRAAMVEYFGKMGITPDRVCLAVEAASVDDITLDKLATLKGYATAIKDSEATIESCFPEPVKPSDKPKTTAEKIKAGTKPPVPAEPAPTPPDTAAQVEQQLAAVRNKIEIESTRTGVAIRSILPAGRKLASLSLEEATDVLADLEKKPTARQPGDEG